MKKTKIIILLIIAFILLVSIITSTVLIINNNLIKNAKKIYVMIYLYEVKDGNILPNSEGTLIYKEEFTSELYYHEKIYSKYGYNEILIKDGIIEVIDSDCPNPFAIGNCRSHKISNKQEGFLNYKTISCLQHGLIIEIEGYN